MWVCQRSLQSVILRRQSRCETLQVRIKDFETLPVVRGEVIAAHEVHRGPFFRTSFGQHQRARWKDKERECVAVYLLAALFPMKAPGDHQMDYQEEIFFEAEHNSLTQPPEIVN